MTIDTIVIIFQIFSTIPDISINKNLMKLSEVNEVKLRKIRLL